MKNLENMRLSSRKTLSNGGNEWGTVNNPYPADIFFNMLKNGTWRGGYVIGAGYIDKDGLPDGKMGTTDIIYGGTYGTAGDLQTYTWQAEHFTYGDHRFTGHLTIYYKIGNDGCFDRTTSIFIHGTIEKDSNDVFSSYSVEASTDTFNANVYEDRQREVSFSLSFSVYVKETTTTLYHVFVSGNFGLNFDLNKGVSWEVIKVDES